MQLKIILQTSIKEGIDAEDDDWQNPCRYARSKLNLGRVPMLSDVLH